MGSAILLFVFSALALFLLTIVLGSYFTVQQQSCAIVERFGKYVRTARPGLNFKLPYVEAVVQRVSLRVQQLIVEVETKKLDNVL
jgi:regulator of protease activity HflC (stomatin/prohibitin superfamily)